MTDLFGLLRDLGERITSNEDPTGSPADEDVLVEARFRAVLPNLFEEHFLPPKVKERELLAILKLLTATIRKYPGVFYHGRAHAVMPIVGYIIPLFAEPSMRAHGVALYETLVALLTLLHAGDKCVYNLLATGVNHLLEDLVSVADFFSSPASFTSSTDITILCLKEACTEALRAAQEGSASASKGTASLEGLPAAWTKPIGPGILVDVTGEARWQPLAEWMTRLLGRCLSEGGLHVSGVITTYRALGLFLAYGGADLHQVCFSTVCLATSIAEPDLIPSEDLVWSLLALLQYGRDQAALPPFRTAAYDTALGKCLLALYTTAPAGTLYYTAQQLIDILPFAISTTQSKDLKVAICDCLEVILHQNPAFGSCLPTLIPLLRFPDISHSLSNCFQIVVDNSPVFASVQPSETGVGTCGNKEMLLSTAADSLAKGLPEPAISTSSHRTSIAKRQKYGSEMEVDNKCVVNYPYMQTEEHQYRKQGNTEERKDKGQVLLGGVGGQDATCESLFQHICGAIECLRPGQAGKDTRESVGALAGLRVMAYVFGRLPGSYCWQLVQRQLSHWIAWILDQSRRSLVSTKAVAFTVEAMESICLLPEPGGTSVATHLSQEAVQQPPSWSWTPEDTAAVLQLPWLSSSAPGIGQGVETLSKAKLRSLRLVASFRHISKSGAIEVVERGLQDEAPNIKAAAVFIIPLLGRSWTADSLLPWCQKTRSLLDSRSEAVSEAVARCVGIMACLSSCSVLQSAAPRHNSALICSSCDDNGSNNIPSSEESRYRSSPDQTQACSKIPVMDWWPLVESLLLFQDSCQVQITFIKSLPRLLRHSAMLELSDTKEAWVKLLEQMLSHPQKEVRAAFAGAIGSFMEEKVVWALFSSKREPSTIIGDNYSQEDWTSSARVLPAKLHELLQTCQSPDVAITLMEAVVEIADAASKTTQLVLLCLQIVMEQLGSCDSSVRAAAVRCIQEMAIRCTEKQQREGGQQREGRQTPLECLLNNFKEDIYEFLVHHLLSNPALVTECADAVFRVDVESLIVEMVPSVFPKLVLAAAAAAQAQTTAESSPVNQALGLLQEVANRLRTDLAVLLLEWCHIILSVLLLQADGNELRLVLEFYESQTGSHPRDMFQAVLPALLLEMVHHLGDARDEAAVQRSARVAPMLQQVASIVTGSGDLPDFLRTYFVGLLNSVDREMLRSCNLSLQQQALRCIEKLVEMIGPHLNAYVPKLMALLTISLQEPQLRLQGLATWHSFIKTLATVAPARLKGVASQIVVAIMPSLEYSQADWTASQNLLEPTRRGGPGTATKRASDEVLTAAKDSGVVEYGATGGSQACTAAAACVLEELVVNNREALDEHLQELPLLPSLPCLERVNRVLHEARGELSLRQQLQSAADGLAHESLSVRNMAAGELKKLLRAKHEGIASMVLGESAKDTEVVSNLVANLLKGIGEESRTPLNQRLKLRCAECLGELGAVDPAKLQMELPQRLRIERSDGELVVELIGDRLSKSLRAASDTDVQDAAALAIQELLKLTGCKPSLLANGGATKTEPTAPRGTGRAEGSRTAPQPISSGERIWAQFSDDVKEIIAPCLTSKFSLKNFSAAMPAGPIYRSQMSFRRWMHLWCRLLISESTGTRQKVFQACRGIVKHCMDTATYLLPYLVLNVVSNGSDQARQGVIQEILAVLAEAGSSNKAEEGAARTGYGGDGKVDKESEVANQSGSQSRAELELVAGAAPHVPGARGPRSSEVSMQCIFSLLDTLGQWLEDMQQRQVLMERQGAALAEEAKKLSTRCSRVAAVVASIPKPALARASFRCQAFARALMYFESHVRETCGALNPAADRSGAFQDEDVAFLLEIYSGLDEPDGLSGIARMRPTTGLADQMLIQEKAGNWADALTCYEQALQMEPHSRSHHSGMLNCLLNMGHLQAMVTHVDGLLSRLPEHTFEWSTRGVQAAWRMGQWDRLDEYLLLAETTGPLISGPSNSTVLGSFDMHLAKILQALERRDSASFSQHMLHGRQALLAPLAAAGMESYTRAYPIIVKLHMLRELEDCSELGAWVGREEADGVAPETNVAAPPSTPGEGLLRDWASRLEITDPSLWTREPILALRRLVYAAGDLQAQVGSCWLQYAKMCRGASHYQTAHRAILQSRFCGATPRAHLESAKLLWDTRRSHHAIEELQEVLQLTPELLGPAVGPALGGLLHSPGQKAAVSVMPAAIRSDLLNGAGQGTCQGLREQDAARMLLQLARWVHHTGQKQKKEVILLYEQVKVLQPRWEKSYFFLAKYYDDLLVDARRRQEESPDSEQAPRSAAQRRAAAQNRNSSDDNPWFTYLPDAMAHYAKALQRGHRHLFQALPRLLTLWFQFGSRFSGDALNKNAAVKAEHGRIVALLRQCMSQLPTYQWLTALPQLVSRITHNNPEVVKLLKDIIERVVRAHLQQALWTMAAVSKSTLPARRDVTAEILNKARSGAQSDQERLLYTQFMQLVDQMVKLCFYQPREAKARTINLALEFAALKRMMPIDVIMPVQRALSLTLPSDGLTKATYNPFPHGEFATISGIGDEAEVLASLQKPKKVVLLGSDGSEHPFLCKPKDDLRKDARMMEFMSMLNRLLSKDAASRRRKLYIRTFAVIPLTEESGMVEWVPHTRGLRHILQDIYAAAGKYDRQRTNATIKRIYDQPGTAGHEAEVFRSQVLPMFPPMFHKWFLNSFPEPTAWFRARLAFAHTSAVWSMVGHIVGLGDRHGENILFDSTTGDCVHVDFSCLFDKGLALEKPELVPFRLTQNMVDGLGITGYEGVFSRICEITLGVLRGHRDVLMSVLETFIHDPLVEWTKASKSSNIEVQNPYAQRALGHIEARLQGIVVGVGAAPSLPLSVEGQAHRLIAEAVSHENLGKMYIWWMPWF